MTAIGLVVLACALVYLALQAGAEAQPQGEIHAMTTTATEEDEAA